jgi:recombination protein RecT
MQCLLDLSSLGLEPDNRRAYLIPFQNRKKGTMECQLIVGYQGYVELVHNSGCVSTMHCDVVCENDVFEFSYGSGGKLVHKPALTARGKVIVAYAYVRLKDGSEQYEVMSVEEVNKIKEKSKASKFGPWIDHYEEMAKKTAFRRLRKWLPISPEIRHAMEVEDEAEDEIETPKVGQVSLEDIIVSDDEDDDEDDDGEVPSSEIGDEPEEMK